MNSKINLEGVRGWLLFLCVVLTVLTPFWTAVFIAADWVASNQYFEAVGGLKETVVRNAVAKVVLAVFSVRAGVALWRRSRSAVADTITYFVMLIVYALVSPFYFAANLESTVVASEVRDSGITQGIATTFVALVWIAYLLFSKRVRATYNHSTDAPVDDSSVLKDVPSKTMKGACPCCGGPVEGDVCWSCGARL